MCVCVCILNDRSFHESFIFSFFFFFEKIKILCKISSKISPNSKLELNIVTIRVYIKYESTKEIHSLVQRIKAGFRFFFFLLLIIFLNHFQGRTQVVLLRVGKRCMCTNTFEYSIYIYIYAMQCTSLSSGLVMDGWALYTILRH